MEERRFDGTTRLTQGASRDDIQRAVNDPRNAEVRVMMPGATVERWENGVRKRYRVTDEGALQRITLDGRDWPAEASQ